MINGRQKGHQFERQIAREFQKMGFDAITKRAARGGDWSTTDDGIDLVGTEPFAVQVKRYRDYVSINTIEEIKQPAFKEVRYPMGVTADGDIAYISSTPPDHIPLLITKADHKPAMAVLPWDDLKKLIKGYYERS